MDTATRHRDYIGSVPSTRPHGTREHILHQVRSPFQFPPAQWRSLQKCHCPRLARRLSQSWMARTSPARSPPLKITTTVCSYVETLHHYHLSSLAGEHCPRSKFRFRRGEVRRDFETTGRHARRTGFLIHHRTVNVMSTHKVAGPRLDLPLMILPMSSTPPAAALSVKIPESGVARSHVGKRAATTQSRLQDLGASPRNSSDRRYQGSLLTNAEVCLRLRCNLHRWVSSDRRPDRAGSRAMGR